MSYFVQEYSQKNYTFRLYDNVKKLTWHQIQKEQGCYAIVNLAYFALTNLSSGAKYFDHQSAIMFAGKWGLSPKYHEYGINIDSAGKLTVQTEKEAVYDYAVGCPPRYINGKVHAGSSSGSNGWTYTGIKSDGTVVIALCSKDTPKTTNEIESDLLNRGCVHIIRWDGSWSSQGTLGSGKDVKPSQYRCCRSWLLVFKKSSSGNNDDKEDNTVSKPIVCLDPGHGPNTVNSSPDKTYYEREFTWDMYERISKKLEACGVHTICTRTEDTKPSLTERATVSNNSKATIFVSLHSNASGSDWSSAKGLEIYTSSGPETAERNILANDLISEFRKAGVTIRSTPVVYNMDLTVLVKTNAPAVLIEYGFHTNKEDVALLKSSTYRNELAEATAKGICDYLGVEYPKKESTPSTPTADTPASWAASSWKKATDKEILDGTRPSDPLTRQELACVLDRLGLLD